MKKQRTDAADAPVALVQNMNLSERRKSEHIKYVYAYMSIYEVVWLLACYSPPNKFRQYDSCQLSLLR